MIKLNIIFNILKPTRFSAEVPSSGNPKYLHAFVFWFPEDGALALNHVEILNDMYEF
jgi:hypothetical protein